MTNCSPDEKNDIAIIGAGPAGLAAALYCARAGLKTIIYGDPYSSQLARASVVENYLTIPTGSGIGIIEQMVAHATDVGANLVDKQIKQIIRNEDGIFSIFDQDGNSECAYAVVLATGTKHKKLGVKGEEEYLGKGVGYCTLCDGPLFKDQPIAIAGFGEEAVQAALRMTTIASQVYMIATKPRLGADPSLLAELEKNPNVFFYENTRPKEIIGDDDGVSGFQFVHKGEELVVEVNAVFIEVGVLPSSAIAAGTGVELTGQFIKVDTEQQTNVEGFYAAGDITGGKSRQAIISAGDGAKAAINAIDYIKRLGVSESKLKTTQWGGSKTTKSEVKTETAKKKGGMFDYVNSDKGFAASYSRYQPNLELIEKIKTLMPDVTLSAISAHWCPDCRRNVPKMAKIMEHLPWDARVEDRDAKGVIQKYNIKKIPTFIIFGKDGKEITRIIENPKYGSLEADLLAIAEDKY